MERNTASVQAFFAGPRLSFPAWHWLLALAGAAAFVASPGLQCNVVNQNAYFLFARRLTDPAFAINDWYTWKVFHHHQVFGYFLAGLMRLGPLFAVSNAAHSLCVYGFSFGLLCWCRRICRYPAVAFSGLFLLMSLVNPDVVGLGLMNLVSTYLQPSSVAGCFMVLGSGLVVARRDLTAGIALGLGSVFHAAFACAFAPVVVFHAFLTGVFHDGRRAVRWGIPVAVGFSYIFGFSIWNMLHAGEVSPANPPVFDLNWLFVDYPSSYHYVISQWDTGSLLLWGGWWALGAIAIFSWDRSSARNEIAAIWSASLLVSLVGILMALMRVSPFVTMMTTWRIAPFCLMLGLIAWYDYMTHFWFSGRRPSARVVLLFAATVFLWWEWLSAIRVGAAWSQPSLLRAVFWMAPLWALLISRRIGLSSLKEAIVLLLGVGMALSAGLPQAHPLHLCWIGWLWAPAGFAVAGRVAGTKFGEERGEWKYVGTVGGLVLLMAVSSVYGLRNFSRDGIDPKDIDSVRPGLGRVIEWVRDESPKGSVFVTPAHLSVFTFATSRAIIANIYAAPVRATETLEWFQRIALIHGYDPRGPMPSSCDINVMRRDYGTMNSQRARELRKRYGADYLLVNHTFQTGDISELEVVFRNGPWAVYRIN